MQDFLTVFKVITAYYIVLWVLFGLCWIFTNIILKRRIDDLKEPGIIDWDKLEEIYNGK